MILAEPVERKFLKALKNSDIEALDFAAQLDEGVREGWITADERAQLEELRAMTLDAISVDDFESWELRGAAYYGDFGDSLPRGRVAAKQPERSRRIRGNDVSRESSHGKARWPSA